MRQGRLYLPIIVFAAIAGFIAFNLTHDARPVEAAGARLLLPEATCSATSTNVSVTFNWQTWAGETQYLDVSTTEHFAPGSFKGHGPMSNEVTSFKVDNLPANTVHFWRINTLGADGSWTTSDVSPVVPCGGPRLLWGPMTCEGRFRAKISFRWAPSAAGINASYLDVGTDAGFAPGTFIGRAQNPATSTYTWTGLQANVLTHFRINSQTTDGRWLSSDLGGFYAECAPPVRDGVIGSGDRLFVNRIGINAPVNVRDIHSDGIMGDPAGPLDVVRYNFPLVDGFGGYPGDGGTTMIAGHLDFRNYGLAVFGKLKEMAPGDIIDYLREDGVMVTYQVDWVEDVTPDYPFGALARATTTDTLVLITCTGQFDWSVEEYPLRRVVYATKVTAPAQ